MRGRAVPRRWALYAGIAFLWLVTSAADGESDARILMWAIGGTVLSVLAVFTKRHFDHVNQLLDKWPHVHAALYGIDDGEGGRTGGVLGRTARIERDIAEVRRSVEEIPALTRRVEEALGEVVATRTEAALMLDATRTLQQVSKPRPSNDPK